MKGRTVGLVALAAFLLAGVQATAAQDITIGALGGVNFANISTDDPDLADTESLTGFQGGVFVSFGVGPRVEIRPELLYSGKGFRLIDGADEADLEINYIEIPVLVRVNLAPEGQVQPVIFAGPAVSFEASCEVEGTVEGFDVEADCDDPEIELLRKSTDVSVLLGAGLDFDVGGAVILVEGTYDIGLRALEDDDSDGNTKSRVFALRAGVGIPVG